MSTSRRLFERLDEPGDRESLPGVIEQLCREGDRFHMDGGSWTAGMSWVRGYGPMEAVSALCAKYRSQAGVATSDRRYRNGLFHLLVTQTSGFRYWGQGTWTDYGRELCRRAMEIVSADLD